jgi:hypothetical protein
MAYKKDRKSPNKNYLIVQPIQDLCFADYNYFVETPEHDVMYFSDKKQARSFIEFYKQYQERKNAKVIDSISVA